MPIARTRWRSSLNLQSKFWAPGERDIWRYDRFKTNGTSFHTQNMTVTGILGFHIVSYWYLKCSKSTKMLEPHCASSSLKSSVPTVPASLNTCAAQMKGYICNNSPVQFALPWLRCPHRHPWCWCQSSPYERSQDSSALRSLSSLLSPRCK